jgi:hypothetical protein
MRGARAAPRRSAPRARIERRHQCERSGLRRYRPGPGGFPTSPDRRVTGDPADAEHRRPVGSSPHGPTNAKRARPSRATESVERIPAHVWWVSAVVIVAGMTSILDTTIVNVVLATLGRDLHTTIVGSSPFIVRATRMGLPVPTESPVRCSPRRAVDSWSPEISSTVRVGGGLCGHVDPSVLTGRSCASLRPWTRSRFAAASEVVGPVRRRRSG